MERKTKRLYEFGPFRMDPEESLLLRDGKPVYLKPKIFETLRLLVENRGRVLDRETLMQRLWQDTVVEEANLTVSISQLRKALNQNEDTDQFIETVPRRGYRFSARVREVITEEAALVVREFTSSRITIEEETSDQASDEVGVVAIEDTAAGARPTKAASFSIYQILKRNRVAAIAAVVVGVAAVFVALLLYQSNRRAPQRFQKTTMSALQNTGRSLRAAISPDGKYVAHATMKEGMQSLWLRQASTGADVELVPPENAMYYGLAFSTDGDYVLYCRSEYPIVNDDKASIFKVPALGGRSVRLVKDVDTDVAVSPDGKRIAFSRTNENESNLIIANEDGTEERVLATRKKPGYFRELAWSPNGRIIACTAVSSDQGATNIDVCGINVDDGTDQVIGSQRWRATHGIEWLPDGNSLVLAAQEKTGRSQIWQVSYPEGDARNVTNDPNDYVTVSVTSDLRLILTNSREPSFDLWIVSDDDWDNAQQITSGATGYNSARWTPDGRIVAQSMATGNLDIWIMQGDGNLPKQLTTHSEPDASAAVSPDGRYIAFESLRSGSEHIWRMDSNGENAVQLTTGKRDKAPQFSSDGNWVVYSSYTTSEPTLWKVPVTGGRPVQLTNKYSAMPDVSPDGKWIACLYRDQDSSPVMTMAIIPFEGGKPTKVFAPPANGVSAVRWTPDGQGLSFSSNREGAHEVWLQPVDGGPPRPLTRFKTALIQSFDWSPDGHKLVCVRHVTNYRVVLIRDSAN